MMLKITCLVLLTSTVLTLTDSINIPKSELKQQKNDTIIKAELNRSKLYGRNCAEATLYSKQSGIYEILIPSYSEESFEVACDTKTQGGGWTVILSRMDGSVDFYRNWKAYKNGFGDLDGEFFLGLDKIHALTAERSQELLVLLEDVKGVEAFEMYEKFAIGDEDEMYALDTLGKASGTAGDSLRPHQFMKFSTFDRENSPVPGRKCAKDSFGAWWYNNCHHSNLAGRYGDNTYGRGVTWMLFRGHENSLKKAVMMIRPRKS